MTGDVIVAKQNWSRRLTKLEFMIKMILHHEVVSAFVNITWNIKPMFKL